MGLRVNALGTPSPPRPSHVFRGLSASSRQWLSAAWTGACTLTWLGSHSAEHLNLSLTSSQGDGTEGNAVTSSEHRLRGKGLMSGFLEKYFRLMNETNSSTLRRTLSSLMIYLHAHTHFLPGVGSKCPWVRKRTEVIIQL